MASEYKAPSGGACPPDGSRSPYQDSPKETKGGAYPKGSGEYKGRGGYPASNHRTSGGYPKKPK